MTDHAATAKDVLRIDERHNTAWINHEHMHELDREGVRVATAALNVRLEGMNAFRAEMNEMSREFLTKDQYDRAHEPLIKRMDITDAENRRLFALLESTMRDRLDIITKDQRALLRPLEDERAGRLALIAAVVFIISLISIVIVVANFVTRAP